MVTELLPEGDRSKLESVRKHNDSLRLCRLVVQTRWAKQVTLRDFKHKLKPQVCNLDKQTSKS